MTIEIGVAIIECCCDVRSAEEEMGLTILYIWKIEGYGKDMTRRHESNVIKHDKNA